VRSFRIGSADDPDLAALDRARARKTLREATPAAPLRASRSLSRLLGERSAFTTFRSHVDQARRCIRSSARGAWIGRLLNRPRLERLLADQRIPVSAVHFADASGARTNVVPSNRLDHRLFGARAVAFTELDRHDPRIQAVCFDLARSFKCFVSAEAVFVPAEAAPGSSYSQTYSSFIVQAEGSSVWSLPRSAVGPRRARVVKLSQGDCLHVPSHVAHRAHPGRGSSLTLRFSIHEPSARDVLAWLGDHALLRCSEDPLFRRSAPVRAERWTSEDHAYLDECFIRFRAAFRDDEREDLLEDLCLSRGSGDARSTFTYGQLLLDLEPATKLARKPALFFVRRDEQQLILKLAHKKLLFPSRIATAFDFVTSRLRFRIREIPGLTNAGRLVLVRRLLREGFLALVDA